MSWYHWLIVVLPLSAVMWLAFHCRKYTRGVADYLAAGRVCGRYVISVAGCMDSLGLFTIIAGFEVAYQTGYAMGFWNRIFVPLGIFLSLNGYINYRFRETCAISGGQFLEMRYSRPFRFFASIVRVTGEMLANCIAPAVAARFFIYLVGIPHRFVVCGREVSTFVFLLLVCILLALAIILAGGRVSLIVTDTIQGLISYPVFVILTVFILSEFSWSHDIAPVLAERVAGESFINPYDVSNLRDFNMFGLVVALFGRFFGPGAIWIGNETGNSGRTPHEQKMAGIIGAWRGGFSGVMCLLLVVAIMTVASHARFAAKGHAIRQEISRNIIGDIAGHDEALRDGILGELGNLKPLVHDPHAAHFPEAEEGDAVATEKSLDNLSVRQIRSFSPYRAAVYTVSRDKAKALRAGDPDHVVDPIRDGVVTATYAEKGGVTVMTGKLSRFANADTPYKDTVHEAFKKRMPSEAEGNQKYQNYNSLFNQMLFAGGLRHVLPPVLLAIFVLLAMLLMITTDDTRIFNSSSVIAQDIILPLFRKPPTPELHVLILKLATVFVCIVYFVGSVFLSQLDFLNLFTTICVSIWGGGAGAVIVFGLYSRWGTKLGAWAAIIAGGGFSGLMMAIQRNWAAHIYPWLAAHGMVERVGDFLDAASRPFNPYIVWKMSAVKFPINSMEISFIAMIVGIACYWLFSLLEHAVRHPGPFNMDRMLHRGIYADARKSAAPRRLTWKRVANALINITPDYTKGDKAIAWGIFFYSIVYGFGLTFVGVWIWNGFSPWTTEMWATYFLWTHLVVPGAAAVFTTVWFFIGGVRDMRQMFRDLAARKRDALDNGMVEGHVSISDKADFDRREAEVKSPPRATSLKEDEA